MCVLDEIRVQSGTSANFHVEIVTLIAVEPRFRKDVNVKFSRPIQRLRSLSTNICDLLLNFLLSLSCCVGDFGNANLS